jgi:hypothetical protein
VLGWFPQPKHEAPTTGATIGVGAQARV